MVTCHESAVENKEGKVLRYRPGIPGSFKDAFGRCFDSVFLTRAITRSTIVNGSNTMLPTEHYLLTAPPSEMYACGDGIGGKGGKAALPPKVENTYQALQAAWAANTNPDQDS